ncbi:carbon-nitrogen hydrolase family protein [Taklimakanibacter deserti]|uniref:carbon-nitrogen hydrolase family protein n=1 Tax=Taklimakanibacter deserti TaxID=2267839 RepID=UPI000E65A74D
MISYPSYKVAAAHVAPIFHDTDRSVLKACATISEAAAHGASLIVFPEGFIPGFPIWSGVVAPIRTHDHFKELAAAAIEIDGPELDRIRSAARKCGVFVSIGFTEATKASVGCLWNANVLIGEDGTILNHHRKLVPTFYEKLVWASGDGAGLRVVDTRLGRLGALICGENTNPLARYTLMAQGEQVHISTYPSVYPTRPLEEDGNYDLENAIRIRAGAHSFEAKVFNIVASAPYDRTARKAVERLGNEALALLEASPKAVSMIIDPTGVVISPTLSAEEGLAYADVDIARCVEPKRLHDVVGYYNRFDVFKLTVDRTSNHPVLFEDDKPPAFLTTPKASTVAPTVNGKTNGAQGHSDAVSGAPALVPEDSRVE